MTALTITCPHRGTCRSLTASRPTAQTADSLLSGLTPRLDSDPICPMTRTTNCNGADATKCPEC